MKLVLDRKRITKGVMGKKTIYSLTIKADLTDQEKENLNLFEMNDTVLYSDASGDSSTWGMLKDIATSTVINVSHLANGRTIECKTFHEVMAVEHQVVSACKSLKSILEAMANYEGEHVIEI